MYPSPKPRRSPDRLKQVVLEETGEELSEVDAAAPQGPQGEPIIYPGSAPAHVPGLERVSQPASSAPAEFVSEEEEEGQDDAPSSDEVREELPRGTSKARKDYPGYVPKYRSGRG